MSIKYVIARNAGPVQTPNGLNNSKLVPGHRYEVIHRSYVDKFGNKSNIPLEYNPKEPKFYIRIKDDTGINSWSMWHTGEHDYWNDYFLSTEEMREENIKKIIE